MGFTGSKTDAKYLGFLFLLIGIILWDLVILRSAFLSGDHLIQHYPFAQFLQNEIRSFRFPWWTSLIHSGFPILAEGQIGAFYPPNLAFLFLLPLKWAYNYEVLFHYGIATVFFYSYIRSLKLSSFAAFISTLIFLFGSTNAGFFYNITSQRVMVWFPLALLLADRIVTGHSWKSALGLGLVFAVQIAAGYQQVAVYGISFTVLYFILRAGSQRRWSSLPFIGTALVLGAVLSAVQWVPMLRLSFYSSRALGIEALAYEGSASPWVGMTLLYPDWTGILRGGFYVGMLGLFFAWISLYRKKESIEKTWWILFAVSLLLALGRFSPLYLLIVQAFKIYFFRVPAKFLFFSAFSLAAVSAYGVEHAWVRRDDRPAAQKAALSMSFLFLIVTAGILAGHWMVIHFQEPLMKQLEIYVREKIYGQPFHPLSMELYREKLQAYSNFFLMISSVHSREFWMPVFLFALQSGIIILLLKGKKGALASWAFAAVLIFDLCYYTTRDIRTDLYPYSRIETNSSLIARLKEDREIFRVHVFNSEPWRAGAFPYMPNQNMLYGLAETGVNSPLAMKEYKEYLGDWGGVDDSLFALPAKQAALEERKLVLDQLNVKYLLANEALTDERLELVSEEKDVHLYRNKSFLPRYFHVARIDLPLPFADTQSIKVSEVKEGELVLDTRGFKGGYVVISEQNYPGWKAQIENQILEPIRLGPSLKAFPLPSAAHPRIRIFYEEKYKKPLYLLSGGSLLFTLLALVFLQLRQTSGLAGVRR